MDRVGGKCWGKKEGGGREEGGGEGEKNDEGHMHEINPPSPNSLVCFSLADNAAIVTLLYAAIVIIIIDYAALVSFNMLQLSLSFRQFPRLVPAEGKIDVITTFPRVCDQAASLGVNPVFRVVTNMVEGIQPSDLLLYTVL